nr:MAG TPA: hypothetical protein [Caudoviricetes sp.]
MGKDIDRNITRQLWERLKNTFTRNDVIPIENGGTGVDNSKDIVSVLTNGTKYVKQVSNTYKNEKINDMVKARININDNSLYLNIWDHYTVTDYEPNTNLILAEFKNTGFMPNVRCSALYGVLNATITLYDGTITISINSPSEINTINGNDFRQFFSFPL